MKFPWLRLLALRRRAGCVLNVVEIVGKKSSLILALSAIVASKTLVLRFGAQSGSAAHLVVKSRCADVKFRYEGHQNGPPLSSFE